MLSLPADGKQVRLVLLDNAVQRERVSPTSILVIRFAQKRLTCSALTVGELLASKRALDCRSPALPRVVDAVATRDGVANEIGHEQKMPRRRRIDPAERRVVLSEKGPRFEESRISVVEHRLRT